ncbi:MAG: 50S ribosomal protein L6 [Proteobacteria bacterium]|nr:50S ribosomal protein L6 [Pseudomonadota bacterium]NCA27768.1 50S ribosomal protein L6 [Pseudomonadota bacterium]
MSRIGKLPITVPDSVKVTLDKNKVYFDSGKIKKNYEVSSGVEVEFNNNQLKLISSDKSSKNLSMKIGMDRSNLKNIVHGLTNPFKIILEINGVGYKASVDKGVLSLTLGYSHEIYYALPSGINASFEKPNLIIITGEDKIMVGQVASEIISFRSPEPYKGKGVKILGKAILRKEGKKK